MPAVTWHSCSAISASSIATAWTAATRPGRIAHSGLHASPCAYNSPAPWQWSERMQVLDTEARIRQQLAEHPVLLYMKGTPGVPECGFPRRGGGIEEQRPAVRHGQRATGTAYPREAAEDLAVADLPAAVPAWRAGRRLRHHPRPGSRRQPGGATRCRTCGGKLGWGECRLSVPRRS